MDPKQEQLMKLLEQMRKAVEFGGIRSATVKLVDTAGYSLIAKYSQGDSASGLEDSLKVEEKGPAVFRGNSTKRLDNRGRAGCSAFRDTCKEAYDSIDVVLLHYQYEILVVPKKFYDKHQDYSYSKSKISKITETKFDSEGRIPLGMRFLRSLEEKTVTITGLNEPYFRIRYKLK